VDELIDRLAVIIPNKAKDRDALSEVGQAARKSLKSQHDDAEWEEEVSRQTTAARNSPMSTDEALEALDAAAQKGEVATWVSLLSNQLDAEREQDLEQRRQRIARQRQGVLQEQLSI
jgi:NTP pyrophosphatase (non-canonical NTP hydrolase)